MHSLLCRFPRPVHHRIPNFVDAEKAAARLAGLPEFKAAAVVKVNPDTPQKMVSRHSSYTSMYALRCYQQLIQL
jgi:hypothetical protein